MEGSFRQCVKWVARTTSGYIVAYKRVATSVACPVQGGLLYLLDVQKDVLALINYDNVNISFYISSNAERKHK